jgi:TonB family protein
MLNRTIGAVTVVALALAAVTRGQEPFASLRLDDDFTYEVVDYGVGAVEACVGRSARVDGVFWIRLKLTNASEHLLRAPTFLSSAAISDNWGNRYTRTHVCAVAKQGRYQPAESSIEVVTISVNELVNDVQELRLTFGIRAAESAPGFAIRDPLRRHRNLSRVQVIADAQEMTATVRSLNAPNATLNATAPSLTPAGVYRPGNGVDAPRVLFEKRPNYTSDAMRAKVQGKVALEILVKSDGTVGDVQVVQSLDSTFGLDQEAVKAAREWRFTPGTRMGEPVPVLITIEMAFTLK